MPQQCVICQKPVDPVLHSFCSERCKQVDLHRWFGEAYAVPVSDEPDQADSDAAEASS